MHLITTKKEFKHELPNGNIQTYAAGTYNVSDDVLKSAKKAKALAKPEKPLPASTERQLKGKIKTLENQLRQTSKSLQDAQKDLAEVDVNALSDLTAQIEAAVKAKEVAEEQLETLNEDVKAVLDHANASLPEGEKKLESLADFVAIITAPEKD